MFELQGRVSSTHGRVLLNDLLFGSVRSRVVVRHSLAALLIVFVLFISRLN